MFLPDRVIIFGKNTGRTGREQSLLSWAWINFDFHWFSLPTYVQWPFIDRSFSLILLDMMFLLEIYESNRKKRSLSTNLKTR